MPGKSLVHVALISVFLVAVAKADGVYIPEQAYPAMPAIPAQRAMITYRNGEETLIVESTFQSSSHSVGWILPVPAEPTRLELGDSGMLTSLSMSLRPRITHDLSQWPPRLICLLALALIPAAVVVFATNSGRRRSFLTVIALVYVFLLLLATLLLPSLGREGSTKAFVNVISSQRLGDYQVHVLHADDADALSSWLKDNGLMPLSSAAMPIAEDYISRRWYFVVSRLTQNAHDLATPCPIAVTFPVAQPIFPMKLTELAGTTTQVELMVVADREATAQGFHSVAADRFHTQAETSSGWIETAEDYTAENTSMIIGSPDAGQWMWSGCTVTKLVADLPPSQMGDDISINLRDLQAHRDHVFSTQAKIEIVEIILLCGAVAITLFAACLFNRRRRPGRLGTIFCFCVAGLFPVAAAITAAALPVIPMRTGHYFPDALDLGSCASNLINDGRLNSNLSKDQIDAFLQLLRNPNGWDINPYSGQVVKLERSPGNFSTRTIGDQVYFCVYTADGQEMRLKLPRPGESAYGG